MSFVQSIFTCFILRPLLILQLIQHKYGYMVRKSKWMKWKESKKKNWISNWKYKRCSLVENFPAYTALIDERLRVLVANGCSVVKENASVDNLIHGLRHWQHHRKYAQHHIILHASCACTYVLFAFWYKYYTLWAKLRLLHREWEWVECVKLNGYDDL